LDRVHVRVNMYLVCKTNTTLCAGCPSAVTITPGSGPYTDGDVLTCMANGYDPVYTWTGTSANGATVSHTGSSYTLPEGVFDVTCTATVSQLSCTDSASANGNAVPDGNYRIQLNVLVTILLPVTLSLTNLIISTLKNGYFHTIHGLFITPA